MLGTEIINKVLLKLDGFRLINIDETKKEYDDLTFNKEVTKEEVSDLYQLAEAYALSYTNLTELPNHSISDQALILWTAGLLFRKYDLRPNDQVDETNTLGYGDSLIIQAKELLKPFKYYKLTIF